jgi:hypothetical protein
MLMILQIIMIKLSKFPHAAAKIMSAIVQSIAEARDQPALIESQLYRGRYRHRSKIDDDLPLAY